MRCGLHFAWMTLSLLVLFASAFTWRALTTRRPEPIIILPSVWHQARSGDLVFRQGTELVSDATRLADSGGMWSHVGLLVKVAHGWDVIHAVPAEKPGDRDAVVMDSISFFNAPARARAIGIYHVDATPLQRQQVVTWARQQLGRPFGIGDGKIYCTELVHDAWAKAHVNIDGKPTHIGAALFRGDYLLPSALLQSPNVHKLWSSEPQHRSGKMGSNWPAMTHPPARTQAWP